MGTRVRVSCRTARPLNVVRASIAWKLLGGVALPALGTTYTYTSAPNYDTFNNFTGPCTAVIDCANYTSAMHAAGSFTTATPLAANLVNVDISAATTVKAISDA
jgi:hypothetical protein